MTMIEESFMVYNRCNLGVVGSINSCCCLYNFSSFQKKLIEFPKSFHISLSLEYVIS